MEPLTIDDLASLIKQKPTIQVLVKIDRCKVDEFFELMWDGICWAFLSRVVHFNGNPSAGLALKAAQEWARETMVNIIASEVIIAHPIHHDDTKDVDLQDEDEASEAGPIFHGDDLIAL
jgi:hypothetical protein